MSRIGDLLAIGYGSVVACERQVVKHVCYLSMCKLEVYWLKLLYFLMNL